MFYNGLREKWYRVKWLAFHCAMCDMEIWLQALARNQVEMPELCTTCAMEVLEQNGDLYGDLDTLIKNYIN